MVSVEKQLERIYRRVINKIPYNMATPFLLNYTNIKPKESFGYPCNWMSEKIGKQLEKKGLCDIYYLRDTRHYLLIGKCEGEEYLFEPYLLAAKPIKIQKQAKEEAYPYSKKPGYIRIKTTKNKLIMNKGRFNPQKNKYAEYHFEFNRNKKEYKIPPMVSDIIRKWIYHPEQTSISIRPLFLKQKKVLHLVYPIKREHGKPVKEENLYIKTNDSEKIEYGEKGYKKHLNQIAKKVKMKPKELTYYLLEAARQYEKHSAKKIKYYSKNPTNN